MSNNGKLLLHDALFRISSPFGLRTHPITKKKQGHNGVDYATYGECPPIYCPFDGGEVLRLGKDKYGALFVYIGFKSLGYVGLAYHCSKITCKVGQKLNKGDIFAYVGSTGRSTGEHLHWGWIVYNNKWNQYYNADYKDFEKYNYKEVEDLTKEETLALIKEVLNGNNTEVSSWAKEYWDKAKKDGILDGTRPKGYVTREELSKVIKKEKK